MTAYQKLVIRLLATILSKLLTVPGVAEFDDDLMLLEEADEAAAGNIRGEV